MFIFKQRDKNDKCENACSNCENRFGCKTMEEIEGSVCEFHCLDTDALTCDDCTMRDRCEGYGKGFATCTEFDLEYHLSCDDCVHMDDCENYISDGNPCKKFKEAVYRLTPKGIWTCCCVEEFGDFGCTKVSMDLCNKFFDEYMHNMYLCGLIQDGNKPKILMVCKMWLKDLVRVFSGKKRMTSKDILLEVAMEREFEGTELSDIGTICSIYDNFVKSMGISGYLI